MSKEAIELREKLAKLAHEQWSGWMAYLFSKCINYKPNHIQAEEGALIVPKWAVERWTRQAHQKYCDLSEQEKNSDRAEADKFLALLKPARSEPSGKVGESKAIEIIKQAQKTHINWAQYLENTPGSEDLAEDKNVGSATHHRKYIKEYDEVIEYIQQLQAQLSQERKNTTFQIGKVNARESHLRTLREENTELQAKLTSSKQEADVMWEGLNGQVVELQAKLSKKRDDFNRAYEENVKLENTNAQYWRDLTLKRTECDELQASLTKTESLYAVATKALNRQIEISEDLVKQAVQLQGEIEANPWISVTEGLPKIPAGDFINSKMVLVCDANSRDFENSFYNYEQKNWQGDLAKPTHWKPITLPDQALQDGQKAE